MLQKILISLPGMHLLPVLPGGRPSGQYFPNPHLGGPSGISGKELIRAVEFVLCLVVREGYWEEKVTSSTPGPQMEQGEQEGGLWPLWLSLECFPISVSGPETPMDEGLCISQKGLGGMGGDGRELFRPRLR